jgi:RHS repeat-associated protein
VAFPGPARHQPDPLGTPIYDMSARMYLPGSGTFTSLDSVMGSAQNPLSMNRFLYAEANPATLIDPTGHVACGIGNCMVTCPPEAKDEPSHTVVPPRYVSPSPRDERDGTPAAKPQQTVPLPNGSTINLATLVRGSADWQQLTDYCTYGAVKTSLWQTACNANDIPIHPAEALGQGVHAISWLLSFGFWRKRMSRYVLSERWCRASASDGCRPGPLRAYRRMVDSLGTSCSSRAGLTWSFSRLTRRATDDIGAGARWNRTRTDFGEKGTATMKLTTTTQVSIDGVMQGPGAPVAGTSAPTRSCSAGGPTRGAPALGPGKRSS